MKLASRGENQLSNTLDSKATGFTEDLIKSKVKKDKSGRDGSKNEDSKEISYQVINFHNLRSNESLSELRHAQMPSSQTKRGHGPELAAGHKMFSEPSLSGLPQQDHYRRPQGDIG